MTILTVLKTQQASQALRCDSIIPETITHCSARTELSHLKNRITKLQNVFVKKCEIYLFQIAKGICLILKELFVSSWKCFSFILQKEFVSNCTIYLTKLQNRLISNCKICLKLQNLSQIAMHWLSFLYSMLYICCIRWKLGND